MATHGKVYSIVGEKELDSFEQLLNDLELSLVTVRDIINRNADGAPFEDSYIGVNLGLYVQHTERVLSRFRELLATDGGARP